jgi:hypothetical protein
MCMNLYEVVFHGALGRDDDADTIYLVRAPNHTTAIETACHSLSRKHHDFSLGTPVPDCVFEIGHDLASVRTDEPLCLRGPYVQCSYNYGWRRWERCVEAGVKTAKWQEVPYEE